MMFGLSQNQNTKVRSFFRRDLGRANISGLDESAEQISPEDIPFLETDKFRDNEGNLFDVNIIGERTKRGRFFKVTDVAAAFEMPDLVATLLHKERGYSRGEDYVTNRRALIKEQNVEIVTLQTFFTYEGLLKVLYASK